MQLRGNMYKACVQRVMVYGSEAWAMKAAEMLRLERTEKMMVRWMYGVTVENRTRSCWTVWVLLLELLRR